MSANEKIVRFRALENEQTLKKWLFYDPITGLFTWRADRDGVGKKIIAGKLAGTRCRIRGYVSIGFENIQYLAHRLAWIYQTGHLPGGVIDHINGVPQDNRWENLRDVSQSVNRQNLKRATALSSTGSLGVFPARSGNGFYAVIGTDGKYRYSRIFASCDEAADEYLRMKRQLHPGCTI